MHTCLIMLSEGSEICSHLQFVAGSQPVNAIAFVVDGLYYGVSDYEYAAYSMVIPLANKQDFIIHLHFSWHPFPVILFSFDS